MAEPTSPAEAAGMPKPPARGAPRWLIGVAIYLVAIPASWLLSLVLPAWHHGVTTDSTGVIVQTETRHLFLWGVVGSLTHVSSKAKPGSTQHCVSDTLHEVKVNTNLGHSLVAVLTLGIWTPAEVEWQCAAPPVGGGELGPGGGGG